jgi:drug/metabolite transporter (DMT)-like permease
MLAAPVTTLLFATSAICGYRTARQIGGLEANFWRITLATIFLIIWAWTFGAGFAGAPEWFILSGLFGIGLGDSAYFQALPRLGSRRTVLITQCLTAPFAALIEWLWLGTKLNLPEIFCVAVILIGVAIALAPGDHLKISARNWQIGLTAGIFAALGGALGAVIIRKGYAAI